MPRLAPPFTSRPTPVACRRSISAQSGGAEHVISRPVSFSTQRKAGMFSFEPSRIPAWLAPVCDERSVSHSTSSCEPSSSQRAMFGALPSRIARRSVGRPSPSISRQTIPGVASAPERRPCRRAIRCVTRSEYSSSSFVPNSTASPIVTAVATRAVSSAHQNESTWIARSSMFDASSSASASTTSTSRKPNASTNGIRSAAITGGTIAFTIATSAAVATAPQKFGIETCGTIAAAASSDSAETSHPSTTRTGFSLGTSGAQLTGSA